MYIYIYIYMCVCKGTVVNAWKLPQHFQLPDKNSRYISRHVYNIFAVFKNSYNLLQHFSRNSKRCSVETSLRNVRLLSTSLLKSMTVLSIMLATFIFQVLQYSFSHSFTHIYTSFSIFCRLFSFISISLRLSPTPLFYCSFNQIFL
jgi:hypothetical protein